MKVLVDTQAIIWFSSNDALLSKAARETIENPNNECYVSIASYWEMSIKINLGKLDIHGLSLEEFIAEVAAANFKVLYLQESYILQNEKLSLHHQDPFDRIIISQAIIENMPIITSDEMFNLYPIQRIW